MEGENFDTDLFINEIEKRPSIWDMKYSDYKDRVIKKKHWEEIVDIFCPDGDVKEKHQVGKLTKKKSYFMTITYISTMFMLKYCILQLDFSFIHNATYYIQVIASTFILSCSLALVMAK